MKIRFETGVTGLLATGLVLANLASATPLRRNTAPRPMVFDQVSGITYQGNLSHKVESFLNIQYGQSTSGNARFAPPKPFHYTNGSVVNATTPGPSCPQIVTPLGDLPFGSTPSDQSEDCLRLRVDRIEGTTSNASLPVMLYIYGGGDTTGTIYDDLWDPTGLILGAAEIKKPVVYVAMNYRSGIFGFAASPALDGTDSLNVGLRDQRLAMEWVQRNIHAFGGDPDNVTLFGESSGASSVGQQIVAYGGKRRSLFKRAIMQSGGPTSSEQVVGNTTAYHTSEVAKRLNCTSSDSSTQLTCLRQVPLQTLLNTTVTYALTQDSVGGFGVFRPIAPSPFLPDTPSKLLRSGRFNRDIPILTGWNEDDGSLFIPTNVTSDADLLETVPGLVQSASKETLKKLLSLYPVSDFQPLPSENISAQYFRASRITRDIQFTCPSLLLAEATAKYLSIASSPYHIFVLNQTAFAGVESSNGADFLGVTHTSDLPFVFGFTEILPNVTQSDLELTKLVQGSWINFAYFGEPVDVGSSTGIQTLQDWEAGQLTTKSTCDASVPMPVRIIGGPRDGPAFIAERDNAKPLYDEHQAERCDFLNSMEVMSQFVL